MKKLLTIALAAITGGLFAATVTWTGGADASDWATGSNWSSGTVPAAGDEIVISSGSVVYTPGADLYINNSLTITGSGTSFTQEGGIAWMQGSGTITVSNGGTFSLGSCNQINTKVVVDGGTFNLGEKVIGSTVDFLSGLVAKFIVSGEKTAEAIWTDYFANGKCKLDGSTIASKDAFDSVFSVVASDGITTATLAEQRDFRFTTPVATDVTGSSASISATLRTLGEGDSPAIVYAYATSAAALDSATWTQLSGQVAEGATYTTTITGLDEDTTYYFAFGVKVGNEVVAKSAVSSFFASDYSAVFTGASGNAWATAGNWMSGAFPTTSDTVLIPANTTCEYSGNISFADYNITVKGGSFTASGEIATGASVVRDGGTLTCVLFTNGGNPIEVRGSTVVTTTPGNRGDVPCGFYGGALNFHSGAPCTYIYNYQGTAPTEATVFDQLFTQNRILVDGQTLSDSSRVTITIGEIPAGSESGTITVVLNETTVAASFEGASTAAISGRTANLSVKVEVSGDKALYLLSGSAPDALTTETLVAATTQDATTYTTTLSGDEGAIVYWQFRLGGAEDTEAVLDSATPQNFLAIQDGNIWKGTSSANASVAANWSKGAVPGASDAVYVVESQQQKNLVWDISGATVASWKQIGNVLVTFQTTPSSALTVTGDVDLQGGTWTHTGPSATPSTAVNVSVGGNMTIAAGVSVNAGAGGDTDYTKARGYQQDCGPGFLSGIGGSFAGEGAHSGSSNIASAVSYGSILDPLSYGSGGHGDGAQFAGGGIVKLAVAGTLTVNGTICSRGFGYNIDGYAAGSGGSVNITAGALEGSGRIDANGGNNGPLGPGAGGRVKVALTNANTTFADFNGTIRAFGGSLENIEQATTYDMVPGAAGTVCLIAGNAAPVVKVYNEWRYGDAISDWRVSGTEGAVPSATHLPVKQDGDAAAALKTTEWELSGHGAIRLTHDVTIAKLTIASADGNQKVYTDGYTLKVASLTVDGEVKKGSFNNTADWIVGDGSVEVISGGLVLIFR